MSQRAGVSVTVFSSSSGQVRADTLNHVPLAMLKIDIKAGASFNQELPGSFNGFIYIVEGARIFGASQTPGKKNQVLWLGSGGDNASSEISSQATESFNGYFLPVRRLRSRW